MTAPMRSALGRWWPVLVLVALAALATSARAQDHQTEFLPEANAYFKVSDLTRIYLQASVVGRLSQDTRDGALGAFVDHTLMPLFRTDLQDADWARNRYLWARAGFLLGGGQEGLRDFSERRVVIEATGRVPLPNEVWLVQRGHVDLRSIDGSKSQRWRYRIGVEREFNLAGVVVVPYAQGEVFYDTRFSAISRQFFQAGAEVELTKQWRIEPYYGRQADKQPSSSVVNQLGLVLKYYH
jgi:hypothetical protein